MLRSRWQRELHADVARRSRSDVQTDAENAHRAIVANDRDYMGDNTNGPVLNVLATIYLVILVLVSLATIPLMVITNQGQG